MHDYSKMYLIDGGTVLGKSLRYLIASGYHCYFLYTKHYGKPHSYLLISRVMSSLFDAQLQ